MKAEIPDLHELAAELAQALDMLLNVASDERTTLANRGDLYTALALNMSRQALARAEAAGLLQIKNGDEAADAASC